jgi:two-component system, response regulator PdtaR
MSRTPGCGADGHSPARRARGVDAALEIWERYSIRCLFISGTITAAQMARASPAEPLGFVHKPFDEGQIVALLKPKQ